MLFKNRLLLVKFQRDVIFVKECANIISNLVTEMCKKLHKFSFLGRSRVFFTFSGVHSSAKHSWSFRISLSNANREGGILAKKTR